MAISREQAALVSLPAAGVMFFVAWGEIDHGRPVGDVHLITPAPLTVAASTGSVGSMAVFNGAITHLSGLTINTIIDAEYCAPADHRPLHLDGVTFPRRSEPSIFLTST